MLQGRAWRNGPFPEEPGTTGRFDAESCAVFSARGSCETQRFGLRDIHRTRASSTYIRPSEQLPANTRTPYTCNASPFDGSVPSAQYDSQHASASIHVRRIPENADYGGRVVSVVAGFAAATTQSVSTTTHHVSFAAYAWISWTWTWPWLTWAAWATYDVLVIFRTFSGAIEKSGSSTSPSAGASANPIFVSVNITSPRSDARTC